MALGITVRVDEWDADLISEHRDIRVVGVGGVMTDRASNVMRYATQTQPDLLSRA